jgi:hypothetical protein
MDKTWLHLPGAVVGAFVTDVVDQVFAYGIEKGRTDMLCSG